MSAPETWLGVAEKTKERWSTKERQLFHPYCTSPRRLTSLLNTPVQEVANEGLHCHKNKFYHQTESFLKPACYNSQVISSLASQISGMASFHDTSRSHQGKVEKQASLVLVLHTQFCPSLPTFNWLFCGLCESVS